jgi:SpoU rRNA Methylase family
MEWCSRPSARRPSVRRLSRPRPARPSIPGTLAELHGRGIRVIGTEADAPLTTRQADLRGPIAIVIGSEGHGLAPAVRRRCDVMVRIPMRGSIGSLNAAVAGSVLLFEALGQRDPDARPPAAGAGQAPPEEPRVPGPSSVTNDPGEVVDTPVRRTRRAAGKVAVKGAATTPAEPETVSPRRRGAGAPRVDRRPGPAPVAEPGSPADEPRVGRGADDLLPGAPEPSA